jgi:type VI secretion system protein ImpA
LRRAQRLMQMTFYEIVRDMAPAALPQLDVLAGQPERLSGVAVS